MAYTDVATLAADTTFQAKVKVAIVDAAVDVMAESEATAQWQARRDLAVRILADPEAQVARIAMIVAASNETIRAAAPAVPIDGDTAFAVASLWTSLAVR